MSAVDGGQRSWAWQKQQKIAMVLPDNVSLIKKLFSGNTRRVNNTKVTRLLIR